MMSAARLGMRLRRAWMDAVAGAAHGDSGGPLPGGLNYVAGNQPSVECHQATLDLFDQERHLHRIVRFGKLPGPGEPFDLITAYEICFNWHDNQRDQPWGILEWQFFLRDLKTRLAPGGRIVLAPVTG